MAKRSVVTCLIGLALVFAWTGSAFAGDSPPRYARPSAAKHSFAASSLSVVVTDATPKKKSAALQGTDLAGVLEARARPTLGKTGPTIVLRVKVTEAREVTASPPVVRAVVEVSVEHGEHTLAATRGTSTLHGVIGGMTPRTEERIRAAVIDAFERSVVRDAFIDAANTALANEPSNTAAATPTHVADTNSTWTIAEDESFAAAHVVSAVFDAGKSYALGLRYHHDHLYGSGGLMWGGYGLEARMLTNHFQHLDAAGGLAVVRGGVGFEQAFSLELGFGAAGHDAVRPLGVAGLYLSVYYVDLGFTYQFFVNPTAELRPLRGPMFGIRINVPIKVHGLRVECHSPLPCKPELIWGIGRDSKD